MPIILLKSTGVWLVIVVAAVLNGLLREKVLLASMAYGDGVYPFTKGGEG